MSCFLCMTQWTCTITKLTSCREGCWDGRFCWEVWGYLTRGSGVLDPDVMDCTYTCTMRSTCFSMRRSQFCVHSSSRNQSNTSSSLPKTSTHLQVSGFTVWVETSAMLSQQGTVITLGELISSTSCSESESELEISPVSDIAQRSCMNMISVVRVFIYACLLTMISCSLGEGTIGIGHCVPGVDLCSCGAPPRDLRWEPLGWDFSSTEGVLDLKGYSHVDTVTTRLVVVRLIHPMSCHLLHNQEHTLTLGMANTCCTRVVYVYVYVWVYVLALLDSHVCGCQRLWVRFVRAAGSPWFLFTFPLICTVVTTQAQLWVVIGRNAWKVDRWPDVISTSGIWLWIIIVHSLVIVRTSDSTLLRPHPYMQYTDVLLSFCFTLQPSISLWSISCLFLSLLASLSARLTALLHPCSGFNEQ